MHDDEYFDTRGAASVVDIDLPALGASGGLLSALLPEHLL